MGLRRDAADRATDRMEGYVTLDTVLLLLYAALCGMAVVFVWRVLPSLVALTCAILDAGTREANSWATLTRQRDTDVIRELEGR